MKMKKILASVAASVVAVSAMAVVANAGTVTASIPFKDDGSGNWQLMLKGDSAAVEVDVTKIASFDLTLTFDVGEDGWVGGAIILQSDSVGWNQDLGQWENATGNGKAIEGVESGKAIHCEMPVNFSADDTYAAITFQSYGEDVDLTALTAYDADGNKLFALAAEEKPDEKPTEDPTEKPDDNKEPVDTGVEGVAAVFGVAVVAAGAMVVAKKRK